MIRVALNDLGMQQFLRQMLKHAAKTCPVGSSLRKTVNDIPSGPGADFDVRLSLFKISAAVKGGSEMWFVDRGTLDRRSAGTVTGS